MRVSSHLWRVLRKALGQQFPSVSRWRLSRVSISGSPPVPVTIRVTTKMTYA